MARLVVNIDVEQFLKDYLVKIQDDCEVKEKHFPLFVETLKDIVDCMLYDKKVPMDDWGLSLEIVTDYLYIMYNRQVKIKVTSNEQMLQWFKEWSMQFYKSNGFDYALNARKLEKDKDIRIIESLYEHILSACINRFIYNYEACQEEAKKLYLNFSDLVDDYLAEQDEEHGSFVSKYLTKLHGDVSDFCIYLSSPNPRECYEKYEIINNVVEHFNYVLSEFRDDPEYWMKEYDKDIRMCIDIKFSLFDVNEDEKFYVYSMIYANRHQKPYVDVRGTED